MCLYSRHFNMLTHHQWLGNSKGTRHTQQIPHSGRIQCPFTDYKEVSLKNKTIQINEALMDTSLRFKKVKNKPVSSAVGTHGRAKSISWRNLENVCVGSQMLCRAFRVGSKVSNVPHDHASCSKTKHNDLRLCFRSFPWLSEWFLSAFCVSGVLAENGKWV